MKLAKTKGSFAYLSIIYRGTHRKLRACLLVEANCWAPNMGVPTKYHISMAFRAEDDRIRAASPASTSAPVSPCLSPAAGIKREAFSRELPAKGLKRRLPIYPTLIVFQETLYWLPCHCLLLRGSP